MSPARPGPHNLQALPTLTEVIEMTGPHQGRVGIEKALQNDGGASAGDALRDAADDALPGGAGEGAEAELVERVLADLLRQADSMFEYRLREALSPVLARLADNLLRESRQELAATLRDVVARAVTQELARRRSR